MRRILPALAVLLLLVTPVAAQDYQKGLEAAKRGDHAAALREWRPLADDGHAKAQFNIGFMYSHGEGLPADPARAAAWYRLAAENDHVEAQNNLGVIYALGNGVPRDFKQAYMWFSLAADRGYQKAVDGRDMAERLMIDAEIAEAQRLARDWLEKHPK